MAYNGEDAAVACTIYDYGSLQLLRSESRRVSVSFPYIPALLSFREGPPMIELIKDAEKEADLYLIDGHGVAHPHRMGLASYVGVMTATPTVGVAKSLLCGKIEEKVGLQSPIMDSGEVVGSTLRSTPHSAPLYVSIGHRTSLRSALEVVSRLIIGHRLPEPLWMAKALAKKTLFKERV
jgi:deoxyribonuclease V